MPERTAALGTQHAKGLPRFRDILKAKRAYLPFLAGPATHAELRWDLTERMHDEQVFMMVLDGKQYYVSKQALEHFLRAV